MNKITSFALTFGLTATACFTSLSAQAFILFEETFDTDTVDLAETQATYPNFTYSGSGDALVSGGQLNLTEMGASSSNSLFVTVPTTEELLIKGDITKLTAGGDENVGLVIGDNRLVFHPGFSGGAFRVEGAGGFGNQNMGFTPGAFPTFHAFEIQVTTVGEFEIKVTDGDNSSNVYTASFTNPSYTPGELIGFTTRGSNLGRVGVFDNLQISTIESASVPEPKTLLSLLTVGGLGLAMKRKKHSEKRHGSTMG